MSIPKSKKNAFLFFFILLSLVLLFHLTIILQIIPYSIVWAGKLNTVEEMYQFETVSIAINSLLIVLLIIKQQQLKKGITNLAVQIFLWLFIILFALNTIGNLMAETLFEKIVFTPLTLLSSILLYIIIRKSDQESIKH